MSTSSSYSSNKLEQVLNNGTQHFIIKSFITAAFECELKKTEYHLYWHNANSGSFPEMECYMNLSSKKMSRKEMRFFTQNITQYDEAICSDEGKVWHHKELGFNNELVTNKTK